MEKKKLFILIAAIILLVGIVLGFSAVLISSTIYDGNTHEIPTGIALHIFVIMLFIAVATVCLYLYMKTNNEGAGISKVQYAFLGSVFLSGLFFSLASGYHGRSAVLTDYYDYIKSGPVGFYKDVLDSDWFPTLPGIATGFSGTGTAWYIITCIAIIATVIIGAKVFTRAKTTSTM